MKYKDWLLDWIEDYVRHTTKRKTCIRYTAIVEQHIIPNLGDYEITELDVVTIQKFVTHLLEKGNLKTGEGLSANSVNAIITVIQSSLETAQRVGVCKEYVGDKIKRPKAKEKQIACFSCTEQKRIEQAIKNSKKDKLFGILLSLYTGLRIGELLALEWSDVDFAKCELSITKTCYDGKDEKGKFCRVIDTPKTASSIRVIPIPKQLLRYFKEIKKRSESKYVVGNGTKGISVRSYQKTFSSLLNQLGLPHRGFHSLRHIFATRALECGMDVKTLSEILGRKNPTITLNRYAHSMMEHEKDMMNKLGELL